MAKSNYNRNQILDLIKGGQTTSYTFHGYYRHSGNEIWASFTNISILENGNKTKLIDSHVNLPRTKINNCILLDESHNNKAFTFKGSPNSYNSNGTTRGSIKLIEDSFENT